LPDLPVPWRSDVIEDLHATLAMVEEELEALKPYLRHRTPPAWAVVQYRSLVQLSQKTTETLLAMEDAQAATMH
jgi:hypothetical protein